MAAIIHPSVQKRYIYYGTGSASNAARWAYFALFFVFILALLFYTLRVNKRRLRTGSKPIAGTAWMTPPSYFQSQTQYNEPLNSTNVPPYSANALPNDAGYYDSQGNFVANPQFEPQQPPKTVVNDFTGESSNGMGYERPTAPPPAHNRSQNGGTFNTGSEAEGYYNNNYNNNNNNNNNNDNHEYDGYDDLEMHNFTRPSGPPPAVTTKTKN